MRELIASPSHFTTDDSRTHQPPRQASDDMDIPILSGPLGLVQQQINSLQAQQRESEKLLSKERKEKQTLYDKLLSSEQELSATLGALREENGDLKGVIKSKDERLRTQELEIQLLKSKVKSKPKEQRNREEESDDISQSPKAVPGVDGCDSRIEAPQRGAKGQEEPRARIKFPCFQVLEKPGSQDYCDMHDGGHLNDDGSLLRQLAKSFKISRHTPQLLRAHHWKLSRVATEQYTGSPHPPVDECPGITHGTTPAGIVSCDPVNPRRHEQPQATICKASPSSDSSRGGQVPRPSLDSSVASMEALRAEVAERIDHSIAAAFRDERRERKSLACHTSPPPSDSEARGSVTSPSQISRHQDGSQKRTRSPDATEARSDIGMGARRPVCLYCFKTDSLCNHSPVCANCAQQNIICRRKRCNFGLNCRHPRCLYMHPGQYDESDKAWIVERGSLPWRS